MSDDAIVFMILCATVVACLWLGSVARMLQVVRSGVLDARMARAVQWSGVAGVVAWGLAFAWVILELATRS